MSYTERSANLLVDAILTIESKLIEEGIEGEVASKVANAAIEKLRNDFGGEQFYFPKGVGLDSTVKKHKIYEKFRGNNIHELAKEFGVTPTYVYRIVKLITEQERKEKQPELF